MTKRKNHSPDFKAKVAPEAIREEMTMAELSKKYGVHPTQIGAWKRTAIQNMASTFSRRGSDQGALMMPGLISCIPRLVLGLDPGIGQLVVERDFLANASVQLLGTRGKKW